jgi:hypothetical protein
MCSYDCVCEIHCKILTGGFPTSHYMQDLDLYCRSNGDQWNSFHLMAGRATQKTSSNIF